VRAIDSRARSVNSAGFSRGVVASRRASTPTAGSDSGSCALVWSVTMSIGDAARSSSGRLGGVADTPIDSGRAGVARLDPRERVVEVVGASSR
jgi:hypothetical protein